MHAGEDGGLEENDRFRMQVSVQAVRSCARRHRRQSANHSQYEVDVRSPVTGHRGSWQKQIRT